MIWLEIVYKSQLYTEYQRDGIHKIIHLLFSPARLCIFQCFCLSINQINLGVFHVLVILKLHIDGTYACCSVIAVVMMNLLWDTVKFSD